MNIDPTQAKASVRAVCNLAWQLHHFAIQKATEDRRRSLRAWVTLIAVAVVSLALTAALASAEITAPVAAPERTAA